MVYNYILEVNDNKMVSLTENEAGTINFLIRNFSKRYNINQLSKELKLSPRGIFKILKKLEKRNYLISDKQGNSIFYEVNYNSEDALDACKFSLSEKKMTPFLKALVKDMEELKEITKIAILFGSILTKEKEANDIDLLLIFDEKQFNKIEGEIKKINAIKSKKIHAVYQTKEDFADNIKERDKVIIEIIKAGIILWGRDLFLEVIKNEQNR